MEEKEKKKKGSKKRAKRERSQSFWFVKILIGLSKKEKAQKEKLA